MADERGADKAVNEEYLGDGVYASWDGGQVWLRTEREGGTHWIAIEPPVMNRLVEYQRRMIRAAPVEGEVVAAPREPRRPIEGEGRDE